jgi:hypothetical protein
VKFGSTPEGLERWGYVADLPGFNVLLFTRTLQQWKDTGVFPLQDMASLIGANIIRPGPLLSGVELAQTLTQDRPSEPLGVTAARFFKPFVPYGRAWETLKGKSPTLTPPFLAATEKEPLTRSQTFMQELSKALPMPLSTAQKYFGMGKVVIDPLTKQPVLKDPSVENLKSWLGWNINNIDPDRYDATKARLLQSAARQLQNAKTVVDVEAAYALLKQLDPEIAVDLKDAVSERKVGVREQQRDQYNAIREWANQP